MKPPIRCLILLGLALILAGCSRKDEEPSAQISTPQQAASQLETVFDNSADQGLKQNARVASEALRQGDYEKAVLSLQAVKSSDKVTIDQGLAVHGTTVMLEARLIQAIENGDPNARKAYDLLKAMKRK